MKIYHYSLGFPPYRTGGLTKFCIDCAIKEKEYGHEVAIIWPGRITSNRYKISFKKTINNGIVSYEIINPLPIPLMNGINDHEMYIRDNSSYEFYDDFFKNERIDIIHIHTLMGLHPNFVLASKNNNVKLVYTTHDYFGICPKVNLFYEKICDPIDFLNCKKCNINCFSYNEIKIMQSPLYRLFKNIWIVKKLRNLKKKQNKTIAINDNINNTCDYKNLQQFYTRMLNSMDYVHCNSSISYNVFKKYISKDKLFMLNISNSAVKDNREKKYFNNDDKLHLLFLGPEIKTKGFDVLIKVLDNIHNYDRRFVLHIYSKDNLVKRQYIDYHPEYQYNQLEEIFKNVDLFVLFSQWYETFGFTVLESLSFGVPCLVSNKVGAKDLLINEVGFICETEDELTNSILSCINDKRIIECKINNIKKMEIDFLFDSFIRKFLKIIGE